MEIKVKCWNIQGFPKSPNAKNKSLKIHNIQRLF